jgi:hypothetical protein
MNWPIPAGLIERKWNGRSCRNPECQRSQWEKWRRRSAGVFLNSDWYCGEDCLKQGMEPLLVRGPRPGEAKQPSAHRLPLGLLMLSRGIIDEMELASVLTMKAKRPGMRIGECMRHLGLVKDEELTRALGVQSCLPVLLGYEPELESVVPVRLQEAAEAFCFHSRYNRAVVFAGFAREVEPSLIRAMEEVLGTTVEACILPERVALERLAALQELRETAEVVFEARMGVVDIMRSICSYAYQVTAHRIRIACTQQYAWARLQGKQCHDLLFRLPGGG